MKTFLILDGNALLHRAWHAIPPLTTKDGLVVNAAYGFTMIVEKMMEQFNPDYMAVAWDLPGKTFRHEAFAEYKGTREKKADELYAQIEIIQEILDAYKIPSLSVAGYEADDIIGTLADTYATNGVRARIVTGDLDALQLVHDGTEVIVFVKGLSETKIYDTEAVRERYGLEPNQLIDFKALMGDASDNIPGVAGVGKKTASELLQKHSTIEGIYEALKKGELPEKFRKKFDGQEELVERMKHLVTIVKDVPLPSFRIEDARLQKPDEDLLTKLFQELEFRTLLRKYSSTTEATPKKKVEKKELVEIVSLKNLSIKGQEVAILLANEQQDLFQNKQTVLLFDGQNIASVDINDPTEREALLSALNEAILVFGHDVKAIMHLTGEFVTSAFDVMVSAYLLSPGTRNFDLSTILYEFLKETPDQSQPTDILVLLWKAGHLLQERVKEEEMERVMSDIEMPLIPVLYDMERSGIAVDVERLNELSKSFAKDLDRLTKKIIQLAGREFNVNSPAQLAEVLFVDLLLPTKGIKKTKSGYSTASSELEKLREEHEIVPLIGEYRELAKLKSTYVDTLPNLVKEDGRIHTTYNQTVAATGRLSSSDPNLQNIPIRTVLGNEIRKAFIARPGHTLVAADFSQIELRLAAVMAKDESFIRAFKEGSDIHLRTAAEVLGKREDEVTKEERYAAKAINFGILYGMGARNLAKSTGFSQEEAKTFIEKYFEMHPGISNYIEEMKQKAHDEGYVSTLFGRKRYLPDIHSNIHMLRAAAERMAVNMPLQGTQADLIKLAMIRIHDWLDMETAGAVMLLQVHDELVFEVKDEDVDGFIPKIRELMTGVYDFGVPLVVDCEVGKNWGELVEK